MEGNGEDTYGGYDWSRGRNRWDFGKKGKTDSAKADASGSSAFSQCSYEDPLADLFPPGYQYTPSYSTKEESNMYDNPYCSSSQQSDWDYYNDYSCNSYNDQAYGYGQSYKGYGTDKNTPFSSNPYSSSYNSGPWDSTDDSAPEVDVAVPGRVIELADIKGGEEDGRSLEKAMIVRPCSV